MEQKRNTHIRKSRYSPKVTEEHTVHPEMTERQKLKKSLSETQNEKKRKTQSSEQPARPVQHQTAASRQRSRRRRRRFRLKPQFKIGGILFLVLLLVFAGGRIFLSGKQTDNKKVKAAASKDAKAAEASNAVSNRLADLGFPPMFTGAGEASQKHKAAHSLHIVPAASFPINNSRILGRMICDITETIPHIPQAMPSFTKLSSPL